MHGPVVLGAKTFTVWGGIGFGTAHPSKLVVGSDPSVIITRIRWHGWGRPTATPKAAAKSWGVRATRFERLNNPVCRSADLLVRPASIFFYAL